MIDEIPSSSNSIEISSTVRNDCIHKCDEKGEISLPIAHYTLISSDGNSFRPKIVIYGLGSCIALILYDLKNNIFAMSHILLPRSDKNDKTVVSKLPHKFADTSVEDLIENMILRGANPLNIKAVIVGGSRIFQNQINNVGSENINVVKHELEKHCISISGVDIGGKRGRIVKYETRENIVYVKATGEEGYRRII